MAGKHRAASGKKTTPVVTAPQTEPDPNDSRFDQPKTFGKGWNR